MQSAAKHLYRSSNLFTIAVKMLRLRGRQIGHDRLEYFLNSFKANEKPAGLFLKQRIHERVTVEQL